MNVFQKVKMFWAIYSEGKKLFKGGNMKALLGNWAGWMKILAYALTLYGYFQGKIGVEHVVIISVIVSGLAKLAEGIAKLTPSKIDDERVAEIVKMLNDKGIIKID